MNYLLRQEKKRIAANIVTNNIDLYLISIWFQFNWKKNWNDSIELIQMSAKNGIDQKTESMENTKYSLQSKKPKYSNNDNNIEWMARQYAR